MNPKPKEIPMKLTVITTVQMITALFLSLAASPDAVASYYQINCGNADGSTRMNSGHSNDDFYVSEVIYAHGAPQFRRIDLDRRELDIQIVKNLELDSKSSKGCREGESAGFFSSDIVEFQQINIKNKDGSLFSRDISGVSADQLSVEAYFICTRHFSGLTSCP